MVPASAANGGLVDPFGGPALSSLWRRQIGLPAWQRSGPRIKGERAIYVPEKASKVLVPVYDRYALVAGDSLDGPAVVEEDESTVIVNGAARVRVDDRLNLVLDLGG